MNKIKPAVDSLRIAQAKIEQKFVDITIEFFASTLDTRELTRKDFQISSGPDAHITSYVEVRLLNPVRSYHFFDDNEESPLNRKLARSWIKNKLDIQNLYNGSKSVEHVLLERLTDD